MRGALVLIGHDRRFLRDLRARHRLWLDRGTSTTASTAASAISRPGATRFWRRKRAAAHKLSRKIVAEEHWVRYGVSGRRKRNMRHGRTRRAAPRPARGAPRRRKCRCELRVSEAQLSGKLVVDAEGLCKSFGEQPIVKNLSLRAAQRPAQPRRRQWRG
ncbi:MAG: hypothetical protein U1E30_03035 [Rhodoblastus sp.]